VVFGAGPRSWVKLSVSVSLLAVAALAIPSVSAAKTYAANCGITGYLEFKPAEWSAGCTGGSPLIKVSHWRWGAYSASARGTSGWRKPCGNRPCSQSGEYYGRGRLRLTRPRTCETDGGVHTRYFSRARWSMLFRPGNPFGRRPGWHAMTFDVPAASSCAFSPS